MSNIVSVTDFRNNIADVLNRVRYRNETIFLVRGKTLVAKVTKVDDYLPAKVSSRKQKEIATGFFPAVKVIAKRELGELREIGGSLGKKFGKKTAEFTKILHYRFRRWVKFCFAFQKNWG